MEFVLNGRRWTLMRATVEEHLRQVVPEVGKQVFVVVGGQRYPIKQAFAAALDVPRSSFVTDTARRILSNLGFTIIDLATDAPVPLKAVAAPDTAMPVSPRPLAADGSHLTVDDLNHMRVRLIWLLLELDNAPGAAEESPVARLARLTKAGRIPADIALLFRFIWAEQNGMTYEHAQLSPATRQAVAAGWRAIEEWVQTAGLQLAG